jgi:hypothetical protein
MRARKPRRRNWSRRARAEKGRQREECEKDEKKEKEQEEQEKQQDGSIRRVSNLIFRLRHPQSSDVSSSLLPHSLCHGRQRRRTMKRMSAITSTKGVLHYRHRQVARVCLAGM